MDPSTLIPPADVLPVAPWILRFLLDATFVAHILLMNVMFGLTLLGLAGSFRGAGAGNGADGAWLAGYIPNATALTVNLAIPVLLFVQALYGQFFYVSSALMGVYWYAVVLAVMAAYGLAYWQKGRLSRSADQEIPAGRLVWALMAALMIFVTLAQTNNALLVIRPQFWAGHFENRTGTLAALHDPSFLPRWLHFVTASVAVGGLVLAMAGRKRMKKGEAEGKRLVSAGMAWFGWATLIQIMDGLWFLVSQPGPVRLAFLGGDTVATAFLIKGAALAVVTLVFAFTGRVLLSAASLVATVMAMTAIRDMARALALVPFYAMSTHEVRPEYSTLAVFLASLVVTMAVVVWAVRTPGAKTPREGM